MTARTPCLGAATSGVWGPACGPGWGSGGCGGCHSRAVKWTALPCPAGCLLALHARAGPDHFPLPSRSSPRSAGVPSREVYDLLSPGFSGRCTAPLLVDRKARRAMCNESAFIARNFAELAMPPGAPPGAGSGAAGGGGGAASGGGGGAVDLYPQALRGEIDRWNDKIYDTGVSWCLSSCATCPLIPGQWPAAPAVTAQRQASCLPPCHLPPSAMCPSDAPVAPCCRCLALVAPLAALFPPRPPGASSATVNNGVYKCGFSTSQAGFTRAEAALFETLAELEAVLRWAWGGGRQAGPAGLVQAAGRLAGSHAAARVRLLPRLALPAPVPLQPAALCVRGSLHGG